MAVSAKQVVEIAGGSPKLAGAPLELLVDYVSARYHQPMHAALWRADELATRVEAGGGDPAIAQQVRAFARNLRTYLLKQEMVLFPAIRAKRGRIAALAIGVLAQEHLDVARQLERLQADTDHFRLPPGASHALAELYERLVAVGIEMRAHIRLERDVLFPRALEA